MVKKARPQFAIRPTKLKMLPTFYQKHLKSQLSTAEYLFFKILLNLLQVIKKVNLEKLANPLPLAIKFASRRKRIQRFLSLPNLQLKKFGCQ